jgi:hypothetical protein
VRQRELGFILGMSELVMNPEVTVLDGLGQFCRMLSDAFAKAGVTLFLQTGPGKATVVAAHGGVMGPAPWAQWQEVDTKDIPLADAAAKENIVKLEGDGVTAKTFCSAVPQAPLVPLAYVVVTDCRLSMEKSNFDIAYLRAVAPAARGFLLSAMKNLDALKDAPPAATPHGEGESKAA